MRFRGMLLVWGLEGSCGSGVFLRCGGGERGIGIRERWEVGVMEGRWGRVLLMGGKGWEGMAAGLGAGGGGGGGGWVGGGGGGGGGGLGGGGWYGDGGGGWRGVVGEGDVSRCGLWGGGSWRCGVQSWTDG